MDGTSALEKPRLEINDESSVNYKKRAALAEIDNAEFGWFHIKACLVSGIGFFTDAYDLFIINIVVSMMGYIYFADEGNVVPPSLDLGLKVSGQVGTLLGQIIFGHLSDRLGRKRMYGVELMIIIIGTIGAAFAGNSVRGANVFTFIIIWRVFMGLGIGGDYPLSAIITSEFATTKRRGAMMAAVFAMQGFGILTAALVACATLAAFQNAIHEDPLNLDYVWRICIGLGAVPGLLAVYFRLTIPETPRYTLDIENNVDQAASDIKGILNKKDDTDGYHVNIVQDKPKSSWKDFKAYFSQSQNLRVLLGVSIAWFSLDIAFYGLNLNNSIVLKAIGYSDGDNPYEVLFKTSLGNIIINLMGTVPGYWVTVFLVDKIGRKPIQFLGFGMLTVIYLILGFGFDVIKDNSIVVFLALFTLGQFFQNFGPNATTFIVPGEVFPTRYRSTGHGIAAASGKLGAIVAQTVFSGLKDIGGHNAFVKWLLVILSGFMVTGFLATFWIPETKGKSLEELSNEDC